MWLYFLGIAKTSCSSFILPQEAFFFHCLLLLERFILEHLQQFKALAAELVPGKMREKKQERGER